MNNRPGQLPPPSEARVPLDAPKHADDERVIGKSPALGAPYGESEK